MSVVMFPMFEVDTDWPSRELIRTANQKSYYYMQLELD